MTFPIVQIGSWGRTINMQPEIYVHVHPSFSTICILNMETILCIQLSIRAFPGLRSQPQYTTYIHTTGHKQMWSTVPEFSLFTYSCHFQSPNFVLTLPCIHFHSFFISHSVLTLLSRPLPSLSVFEICFTTDESLLLFQK